MAEGCMPRFRHGRPRGAYPAPRGFCLWAHRLGVVGLASAILLAILSFPARAEEPLKLDLLLSEARVLLGVRDKVANIEGAIGILEPVALRANREAVFSLLAEAHFAKGHHLSDEAGALEHFDRAILYSERALALDPGDPVAHYWHGLALLFKAELLKDLSSFRMVRRAKADMEFVAGRDDGYDEAGAYRALGKICLDSPSFFFGDVEQAVIYLERARDRAPDSFINRLFLAEAYVASGRRDEAIREITWILRTSPHARSLGDDLGHQRDARALLDRIRERTGKP